MSLITSFYMLSIFFISFQVYEILNRKTFYINPPDLNKPGKYLLFYFTKICSYIWIVGGVFFSDLYLHFGVLLGLIFFKYIPLVIKNNFLINLYDIISMIISIIIMLIILHQGIVQL